MLRNYLAEKSCKKGLAEGCAWCPCHVCSISVFFAQTWHAVPHAGMPAFAASTADDRLPAVLPLCDSLLEALHFCPGFQACLTRGKLTSSAIFFLQWHD